MNKNILITMICFFLMSSCSQIKKNKIKDETLPTNSATRLVNERKSYTDINEPNVKNIDIINGFRELKLNTNIDSLYIEDWKFNGDSIYVKDRSPKFFLSDIIFIEKEITVTMQDKNYDCIFFLTFFKKKLIMIDVNFINIKKSGDKEFLSKNEVGYKIIEPDIMKLYLATFGEGKSYLLKDRVSYDDKYDLYDKKKTRTTISYEIPNIDFEGNLFEIIEHRVNDYKDVAYETKYRYTNTPSTNIPTILKNQKLVEYIADKNGLKLFITNTFVINEKEGGNLFFSYSINNIDLKVKIYNKEFINEYLSAKEQQESSNRIKLEAIYKERKNQQDSINTNKSASEF